MQELFQSMLQHRTSSMTLLMGLVCTVLFHILAYNSFGLQEFGNIYSRIMNPTVDVFEKVLPTV